jgi:hydrogenase nickel incorporation protein HypA/HybF
MHELSVCRFLIQKAEEIANEEGGKKIKMIGVQVGPLAGVEPELLETAFFQASAGTLAAGAKLKIIQTPIIAKCRKCGAESELASPNLLTCGLCHSGDLQLIGGNELMMASLELKEDE